MTPGAQERIASFKDVFRSSRAASLSGGELLSLATKFEKIESVFREKEGGRLVLQKIAVLASCTTHHLVKILRLFLYREGISPEFYEGPYDAAAGELLDPGSRLFAFESSE